MIPTTNSTSPPLELSPLPPLFPPFSDATVLLAAPVVSYWVFSMFFHLLDVYNLLPQYRLHTPEEVLKRNHVTRYEVLRDVVLQHIIQTIIGGIVAVFEPVPMTGMEGAEIWGLYSTVLGAERWIGGLLGVEGMMAGEKGMGWGDWRYKLVEVAYWYAIPAARMGVAIFVLDTWQYFLHRLMHESKWLYRTFHARHHRLYVPYAYGALYNHWFEGLLMDSIGASLAYKLSGLGIRGGMVFFVLGSMKTVDDHCGYSLPWDPLQKLFWNNAAYHDVHHQSWGIKTNFSQPFLICWDRWLGTQWTGGDVSARYKASAEKAAAAVQADLRTSQSSALPTRLANGKPVLPAIPRGKPSEQAKDGRRQVVDADGERILDEETREVVDSVRRRAVKAA